MLPYIGLFLFLAGTIAVLASLKPIGHIKGVDWAYYHKCDSGAEKTMFKELARHGFVFRTQVKFAKYRADFVFDKEKLILEVDSPFHDTTEAQLKDERRDKYLRSLGYEIVRVRCEDFKKDMPMVMSQIVSALNEREGRTHEKSTKVVKMRTGKNKKILT